MKRFCNPLAALLSLILLAGCATDSADSPPIPCPQVAVLAQGATLTQYLPGRTDVAAQVTTAQITGVAGACVLHKQQHKLVVTFQTGFAASNGPANNGAALSLPYFVAITQGENIIQQNHYTISLAFNGNASATQATSKPVKIDLPDDFKTRHLQILVGFYLTPDQLNYAATHLGGP